MMVRLVTTSPILSAFTAIPPSAREDLKLPESLDLGSPISHDQVIRISRYFRSSQKDDYDRSRSLDSLLRGMKLYIPPPPPKPEPSPEYLALKARLLAAVESDAYNRMLSTAPSNPTPGIFSSSTPRVAALHDTKSPISDSDPDAKDTLTPSLVLNIFLSVLITGFSVYWALTSFPTPDILFSKVSSLWYRPLNHHSAIHQDHSRSVSEPVRVLLSLFAALVVGVAEVLIYAIYLGKVEQARAKEKRVKERKEVVGMEEIGGRNNSTSLPVANGGEKDEEVIWGRGPNGGLRRRVREKWEGEEEKKKDEGG